MREGIIFSKDAWQQGHWSVTLANILKGFGLPPPFLYMGINRPCFHTVGILLIQLVNCVK